MKIIGKISIKLAVSVGIGVFIGGFGLAVCGTAVGIAGILGGTTLAYLAISAGQKVVEEVTELYTDHSDSVFKMFGKAAFKLARMF